MSDNDGDFIPTDASVDSSPARNLRRRPSEAITKVGRDGTAKKPKYTEKREQTRIPTDLEEVSALKKEVSELLEGREMTESESIRICRAALILQEEDLLKRRENSTANRDKMEQPNIREEICHIFGISSESFDSILTKHLQDEIDRMEQDNVDGEDDNNDGDFGDEEAHDRGDEVPESAPRHA